MVLQQPKVSIIVTAHNYGRFLRQCLDSALNQNFTDPYEVIVVNDNSTDNTAEVLRDYSKNFPVMLRVFDAELGSLSKSLNLAIKEAAGNYIVRLDADDYFDCNLLLLEAAFLDMHPEIAMVYPDHFRVTTEGAVIDYVKLPKVGDEVTLMDRNPLPGGAMYRKECYEAIGGYNEALRYQEDFDFWIKFLEKYKVHNISLPLLYYRKHDSSMSSNQAGRLDARRFVKEKFIEQRGGWLGKKILAVIPAMGAAYVGQDRLPLKRLCDKPIIAYSIEEAARVKGIDRIVVSTEDEDVASEARKLGAEVPYLRPAELANSYIPKRKVIAHMIEFLKEAENYSPDVVVILPVSSPLRRSKHIREAIDTIFIYGFDSVISVIEDADDRWKAGPEGLARLGPGKRVIKQDKETVYRENSAVYVVKTDNFRNGSFLGDKVGYIEMLEAESIRIENEHHFFLVESVMKSVCPS
jgi:CMP-N-acetylneuraminic acid synthetase